MLTEEEFIQSIQQHQEILFKVCNLYMDTTADREDLYQEIILNAWKGIKNFKGQSKISTWLYSVALNTAISFFKKEKKQKDILALEKNKAVPDDGFNLEVEQLAAMNKAIAELSKVDKALVLLYLDDFSYRQIAQIIGITVNNVGVKMNRIKFFLKERSKKYL